jgi:hypothetical protein
MEFSVSLIVTFIIFGKHNLIARKISITSLFYIYIFVCVDVGIYNNFQDCRFLLERHAI